MKDFKILGSFWINLAATVKGFVSNSINKGLDICLRLADKVQAFPGTDLIRDEVKIISTNDMNLQLC